jgi:poly-beta-1,6-N-acetyl-D-glucosamine synthase
MISYVLITPARNEEANIGRTIKSVVAQTILPKKWVIVSDGSTDRTDDIVNEHLPGNSWIELIRMPERTERNFAAKVACFNRGYEKVEALDFEIVGNLDADISFEDAEYFVFLLEKFMADPRLGVSGTPFVEDGKHYDYRFTSIEHVSGACQLFRRECFEEIGGYIPIKGGGVDWAAVTTARMKGWKTRTFTEKRCLHHRKIRHRQQLGIGCNISILPEKLLFGRACSVATLSVSISNESKTIHTWRFSAVHRIYLCFSQENRKTGKSRACNIL